MVPTCAKVNATKMTAPNMARMLISRFSGDNPYSSVLFNVLTLEVTTARALRQGIGPSRSETMV